MEILWLLFLIFAIGACIGSFLNVVALRALSKESIVFPSSKCPKCNSPIKWYDNIPIFSYLFTFKGKCRNCHENVSKQYPIVETVSAFIFLFTFISFGFSLKTILLLILFCCSIVIIITDFKKEYVFESHAWILIITSILTSLYFNGIENYTIPAIGLISGAVLMEGIAKFSYYLVRKNEDIDNEESGEKKSVDIDSENFDINEYIKTNKRAFGEGDTYLAAASGALLGWKYMLIAVFMAIIFQAVCLLPQFIIGLYRQKQYRLIFSLSAFIVTALMYWIISNIMELNLYIALAFVIVLLFFAIDAITILKKTVNKQGFSAIPFGPSLIISTFITFFFSQNIISFLIKHIFFT